MNSRKLCAAGASICLAFGAGFAVAQTEKPDPNATFIASMELHSLQSGSCGAATYLNKNEDASDKDRPTDAQIKEYAEASDNLAADYAKAANDPALTQVVVGLTLRQLSSGTSNAKSAAQAAQVNGDTQIKLTLLQIAQNERIIELLK